MDGRSKSASKSSEAMMLRFVEVGKTDIPCDNCGQAEAEHIGEAGFFVCDFCRHTKFMTLKEFVTREGIGATEEQ